MIIVTRMFADFEIDESYLCVVEIDQGYARHLLDLMDRAKALREEIEDFMCMELGDYSPDLYTQSADLDEELGAHELDDDFAILEQMPKTLQEEDAERVGYSRLIVEGTEIRWEISPKYTGWSLESNAIDRKTLEDFVQDKAA
jgi:hypothetical protein